MDVRIGISDSPQIIDVDMADDIDRAALKTSVEEALSTGTGILSLADRRGKEYLLPAAKIAFVELGSVEDDRRIGFGA